MNNKQKRGGGGRGGGGGGGGRGRGGAGGHGGYSGGNGSSGRAPGCRNLENQMLVFKTRMCYYFLRNLCNRGANCDFAHSRDELRLQPDLRKTKLCKNYEAGCCKYSDQDCSYAHGVAEVRPSYKLSWCGKIKSGLLCLDKHCNFAHAEEELRTMTLLQWQQYHEEARRPQQTSSSSSSSSGPRGTQMLDTNYSTSDVPPLASPTAAAPASPQQPPLPAPISEHLPPKFDYILPSEHREEHQVVENDHCPVSFGSADVDIEGDDEHEEPPRPNCRHHAEDQVHGDREDGEVDVPPPLPSERDQSPMVANAASRQDQRRRQFAGHDDRLPPRDSSPQMTQRRAESEGVLLVDQPTKRPDDKGDSHFAANSMAEIVEESGSADYVDGHQNHFYDDDDHESWQPPLKGDSQHPHANFANVYDDVPHQHPTTSSVVMPVAKTSTIPPAGIRQGQQQQVLPPVVMPYISPPVVFQGSPLREAAQSSVNSFDLPQQSHYHQQHSAQQWQEKNALLSDDSRSTSANSVQPIAYDPAAAAVVNTIYVPPLEMPPPEMAPSGAFPAFPDVHGGAAPPASSAITPVRSRPRADTAGSLYVSASPAIHPMHSLAQSVRFGPANVCVVTTTTNGQQSSSSGSTKANFTSSSANLASLSLPPSPMADGSQDASFRQQQPHPAWPPRGCQVATAPNSCHVVPLTSPKLGIDPRESPAAPVYIFSPPPPMMEFVDPHSGQLRSPPLHMATGCCLSSSSEELSRLPARQNYFSPVMAPVVWPTTAAGGSFIPATGLPPIMRGHSAQVLMAASPKSYDD